MSPACVAPAPPRPAGDSNRARRLSTCFVTLDNSARGDARIGRRELAPRVLQREQPIGERQQRRRFGAQLVLSVEQRELVLKIVVEQDVVDAPFLTELVEVDLAEPRAPSAVEVAHAAPLCRGVAGVVPPVQRLLIGGEPVDDVGELAGGSADERGEWWYRREWIV